MTTRIVKIGNSQGIRIPKTILEQCGLTGEVELKVAKRQIIISPKKIIRKDWENAFFTMSKNEDDKLLDEEAITNQSSWDENEWEW
jgi:antitoxin MazE